MNNFILIYALHLVAFYIFFLWFLFGINWLEPKDYRDSFSKIALAAAKIITWASPIILWPTFVVYAALNK